MVKRRRVLDHTGLSGDSSSPLVVGMGWSFDLDDDDDGWRDSVAVWVRSPR